MIKVTLHGRLGKIFGGSHEFNIASGADAYKALRANFKKFESIVLEFSKKGQHYMIVVDDEEIKDFDQFSKLKVVKEVHFVPVILGAFIFGLLTLLVVKAFAIVSSTTFLTSLIGSLLVVGITSLLFKPPSAGAATSNTNAGANSYFFGGRTNTAQQGTVVPVGYGRLKIGSLIVHTSLSAFDLKK